MSRLHCSTAVPTTSTPTPAPSSTYVHLLVHARTLTLAHAPACRPMGMTTWMSAQPDAIADQQPDAIAYSQVRAACALQQQAHI